MEEALNGAKYVEVDNEHGITYVWKGGHGVHVHSTDTWQETDYFSVGNWQTDTTTLRDVKVGIKMHRSQLQV